MKNRPTRFARLLHQLAAVVVVIGSQAASAGADFSSGVSDDRVSLPEGPGSLEGVGENVTIDANMATMRWSIPIDVPEGFDGVTPALALNYSSGSGSSIAGIGWTFDVPAVERMTSRGLPEYDEDDLFSAMGDELVRTAPAGVSSSTAAVYRARFEKSFTRWSWIARDNGKNGHWKAEYADGRVAFFGADRNGVNVANARVSGDDGTFRYNVVDVVDVYGHVLHHTWIKDGNESLLDTIEWGSRTGTSRYRVELDYESRDDHQSDAKPGFEAVLTHRLTSIAVFSKGQRIRRYVLGYDDYDDAGGQSRLTRVETRGIADELYPIVQSFTYSRALGAACDQPSCGQPTLVSMGTIGTSLRDGRATLIDMNGDALPDVVDTDAVRTTSHRFFFNQLGVNGAQSFSAPVTSDLGVSAAHALGTRAVQVIDQDGDGFSDIVNALTGEVLKGRGLGDWAEIVNIGVDNGFPSAAEDNELRFMDIDNDKRIDAVRSDVTTTTVYRSTGDGGFEVEVVDALGMSFADENVQFTDMNGDGLLDVVRMRAQQLTYRLNHGRGTWGPFIDIDGLPISEVEDDVAMLEDINGDGLADIVVVTGTTVKYLLNRNGARFDDAVSITSAVGGSIPERTGDTAVLAADMNGNGSTDIVWIQNNGTVSYLDIFPRRAHLLTHIENGIGRVTDVAYTTSVLEAAAAAAANRSWAYQVPFPMTVVKFVDEYDLLSNVHDESEYRYFDGFYDGVERQYRGYEQVELVQPGDEHQEGSLTATLFDVGVDGDAHRAGLKLEERVDGDDREISLEQWTHQECAIAEVPTAATLTGLGRKPVRRFCETSSTRTIKEGRPAAEWKTTATRDVQDGYGNIIGHAELGVVDVVGDEVYESASYVVPGTATAGRWILNAVVRERSGAVENASIGVERVTYYDGTPFVGLAEGQLTNGDVVRVSERVDETRFEDVKRVRLDVDGQEVERLDALGVPGQHAHRRSWRYDSDGLLLIEAAIHLVDDDNAPYSLVQRISYDDAFDKPVQATAWVRVVNDEERSPRNEMFFGYDGFGRITSRIRPGDTQAAPTERFRYDLGSPTTQIVTQRRTTAGGAFDLEQVSCMDGRGREFQKRHRLNATTWQVDGFVVFNLRGEKLRVSQPYTSTTAACDVAPPTGVGVTTYVFDAENRTTAIEHPDGARYETTFLPLAEVLRDPEDLDAGSAHFDTPTVMQRDGLGRLVGLERHRVAAEPARYALRWDDNNRFAGFTDPAGNDKSQRYDLRGRVVEVRDPDAGITTFTYDAAGNLTHRRDARGVVLRAAYDGVNRLIERWDEAQRDETLARAHYDVDSSCGAAVCSNTAGRIATYTYPAGSERFGYDARGNALFSSRTLDFVDYDTRFTFDSADRLTAVEHPDGRRLVSRLDGMGRTVGVDGVVDEVGYDSRGLVAQVSFHNGVTETRAYDERQRLDVLSARTGNDDLLDLAWHYDDAGNVTRTEDGLDVAGLSLDAVNLYDEWYRLASTTIAGGDDEETQAFTYDLIDNVLSATSTRTASIGNVGAYVYDAGRPHAVTQAGSRRYTYDAAGQMTARGGVTLAWDHMGRMTDARVAGVVAGTSQYGVGEQRVAKIERGGVTHYAGGDFEERDGVGIVYVRINGLRVARLSSTTMATEVLTDIAPLSGGDDEINAGDAWVAAGATAGVIADVAPGFSAVDRLLLASARRLLLEDGAEAAYLHRDLLGSAVLATGATGEVLGRQSYLAFGEQRASSGFVDTYAFSGQERDASSGLTHYAHRFLDATSGRWASPDPSFGVVESDDFMQLSEAAGAYAYVNNNPTSFVDPDGLRANYASRVVTGALKSVGKALWGGAKRIGNAAKAGYAKFKASTTAFAIRHPRIATGIRVAMLVTGTAIAIAGAVATGGALGAAIGVFAVMSSAMNAVPIATDHMLMTSGNPKLAQLGAEGFGKSVVLGALGMAASITGISLGTTPTLINSQISFLVSATATARTISTRLDAAERVLDNR